MARARRRTRRNPPPVSELRPADPGDVAAIERLRRGLVFHLHPDLLASKLGHKPSPRDLELANKWTARALKANVHDLNAMLWQIQAGGEQSPWVRETTITYTEEELGRERSRQQADTLFKDFAGEGTFLNSVYLGLFQKVDDPRVQAHGYQNKHRPELRWFVLTESPVLYKWGNKMRVIQERGHADRWVQIRKNPFEPFMEPLWNVAVRERVRQNPVRDHVELFQTVMAHLRALQWVYWTTHWTSQGPNYYADHKLLQRLYEGKGGGPNLNDEIDRLGERMVYYFGPQSVAPQVVNARVQRLIEQGVGNVQGPLQLLALLETSLQVAIRRAWRANQQEGDEMSLGLDNYLMGLADERDTAQYLLRQRLS